jgi:hypothetical protein
MITPLVAQKRVFAAILPAVSNKVKRALPPVWPLHYTGAPRLSLLFSRRQS